jgi:predicted nuclease of predicted toxin-antitoxin system
MGQPISLYADEQVARAVVRGLRLRGLDVLTTAEAGLLGAPDEVHLALAQSQGRVILTQDDDFLRLHAAGAAHAGIIYAAQGTRVGDVIRGVMLIHDTLEAEDMAGHVEFL